MHWYCAASLCLNNYQKKGVHRYRLPRGKRMQELYKKVLKTDGVDWKNGHICAEHWSKGAKENKLSVPDITVPPSQIPLFEDKLEKAKERFDKLKKPTQVQKRRYRELVKKVETIRSITRKASTSSTPKPRKERVKPEEMSISVNSVESEGDDIVSLKAKVQELNDQLSLANSKVRQLTAENLSQKIIINDMRRKLEKKNASEMKLQKKVKSSSFSYNNLKLMKDKFAYLSGLPLEKFDMVLEILSPYVDAILYPDCVGTGLRSIDKATELLTVLIICRHALHLGITSFILINVSNNRLLI